MPSTRQRSLKYLLLLYELAFLLLVVVTGGLGWSWAYFWRQTSVESVRLHKLSASAQQIRSDMFQQIKEVTRGRLMEDQSALYRYENYSKLIDQGFNQLRQHAQGRREDLAIQAMQQAYRVIQQDMNQISINPYLYHPAITPMKILDPEKEKRMVADFELGLQQLETVLTEQQSEVEQALQRWQSWLMGVVPVAVVLAIGLLWFSRQSVQRGFVQPVKAIIEGAGRISKGELNQTLPMNGVEEMQDLAQAINRMATDLAGSRAALIESEKQAALGALVPVVAHNVRNPLASIRANAQMLEAEDDPAEFTEVKLDIISTVDRLGRWVNALVSYLHPLKLHRVDAQCSRVVAAVLGLLQGKLSEKNIEVIHTWDSEEPSVSMDVDLMEQALYGLIANAIEASPASGRLWLSSSREEGVYRICIADEGPGLPFLPVPGGLAPGPSTKRFGTGLGIPIAFKICQAHGWQLAFLPKDTGGTLVTIAMPCA